MTLNSPIWFYSISARCLILKVKGQQSHNDTIEGAILCFRFFVLSQNVEVSRFTVNTCWLPGVSSSLSTEFTPKATVRRGTLNVKCVSLCFTWGQTSKNNKRGLLWQTRPFSFQFLTLSPSSIFLFMSKMYGMMMSKNEWIRKSVLSRDWPSPWWDILINVKDCKKMLIITTMAM